LVTLFLNTLYSTNRDMKFKIYYESLDNLGKKNLAEKLDTSTQYLSQLSSGRRNAGPKFLLNIEVATSGAVMPHEMRSN